MNLDIINIDKCLDKYQILKIKRLTRDINLSINHIEKKYF